MKKLLSLLTALTLALFAFPAFGYYDPNVMTREYVIDCFIKAAGEENFPAKAADLSGFADGDQVALEYKNSMGIAVANGIISGYEDKTLRPENSITRLEALIILGRCLPDVPEKRESTDFSDVPSWAEDEIDRLYRGEIVEGYGSGILGSNDNISEKQTEVLVERVMAAFADYPRLRDDFYAAVNKDYISAGELPPGQVYISRMSTRSNIVDENLNSISEKIYARRNEPMNDQFDLVEQQEKLAAVIYEKALEYDRSSDADISPLNKYFNIINGADNNSNLFFRSGSVTRKLCVPVLFDIMIPYKPTGKNTVRTYEGIYVSYISTGIERSYWEAGGPARDAYRDYALELMSLMGIGDSARIAEEIADLQREIALAGMSYSEAVSLGAEEDEEECVFTRDELVNRYKSAGKSSAPLTRTLLGIDSELAKSGNIYVLSDVNQIDKAIELLNAADLDTLKALCKLNIADRMIDFLPRAYRSAYARLNERITGGDPGESSQEYATALTSAIYPDVYEREFLESCSDFDSEFLSGMVSDIVDTFKAQFSSSIWMSPQTEGRASIKLDKMKKEVGASTRDYDGGEYYKLDKSLSVLEIGIDLYSANGDSVYSVYSPAVGRLPCYTVNATYNALSNKFNIYAGILGSPYYGKNSSYEENLGGIGFIIAHEISHAFDETGSSYNGKGDYDPWWEESDYEKFAAAARRLAELYGGYEAAEGVTVDGELTSDENIADIMAMSCIIRLAKEKNLDLDKVFRAYANCWASVTDPTYAAFLAKCDTHSPDKVRVNAVLSNFDEFYELYGVTEGDAMYVEPEKRVKFF